MALTSSNRSMSTCLNKYVTSDATLQNVAKLDMSGEDPSIADNDGSLCDRHVNNDNDNVSPFLMTVDDDHGDACDAVYLGFVEEAEVGRLGMFDTDRLHHQGDLSIVTDDSELDGPTRAAGSFLDGQRLELNPGYIKHLS